MDFIKVFDQAVREIKREVNLKVLKVPEIEQKVLDATNDEPWGPHGSALSEISQATKKFSECQMVMEVLWNRLTDTGPNWRHVYKALTVIEYLLANGSERAVDDILEHSFQISSLSSFEYVEPNSKDVGINVRKKVETLMGLLSDKEKLQAVRNKASANRDKYVGLSSTGITYKSGSTSYVGSRYKDKDRYGDDVDWKYSKKDDYEKFQEKPSKDSMDSPKKTSEVHEASKKSGQVTAEDEDFNEFDPRGSSTSVSTSFNQVDLFGDSLIGDLMDAPATKSNTSASDDVDLFADAAFVSAAPRTEFSGLFRKQDPVDLFGNLIAAPPASSSSVDLFAATDFAVPASDPFAAVPLTALEEPDAFGDFTSNTDAVPGKVNAAPKKETFQVKSGIWADSLSRGLIDLNLTAPKKAPFSDPPAPVYGVRGYGSGSGSGPGQQDPFGGFY